MARCWCGGRFAAGLDLRSGADLDSREVALLRGHARWGCLSLVCRSRDGRAPFVFGLRRRRGILPFAYLIHCRSLRASPRMRGRWADTY